MITRDRWLLLGCCLALVLAPRSVGAEETLARAQTRVDAIMRENGRY